MIEIKIFGRAGQGAKTMAQFLAELALVSGKYGQAFPSYGPEREGGEMNAFVRIDEKPIFIYSQIERPDLVVVIDKTLISQEVFKNFKKGCVLLVNTGSKIKIPSIAQPIKIYKIDASKIAQEILGRDIPNTVLLGSLVKILKIKLEDLLKVVKEKFVKKLGLEMAEKNLKAIKKGYEKIKI